MPEKAKHTRAEYLIRRPAHTEGDVQDYVEAHAAENPPKLSGSDLAVEHRPRAIAEPVVKVSRDPHVDHLAADLYSILLSQSDRLRKKSESEELDAADMTMLAKLVDGTVRLTKLQLEREKQDRFDALSEEDLRRELEEARRKLEE